ncbi:MarR family transcriptional regulator [Alicyclobacillus acidoterrestris]|uniref:MarR family winged helix-turn-helix transcriptional regulator n=1 Tax=Alicyclobacillus suci TaxID=2816080 RepID=UPI001195E163|nr:MarR family transcriptional regulator [Alicyclobacillus suci]GEO24778.1 MarR family transcriptional regulator [Alicyclobacillus acidoterrestris]
MAYNPLEDSLGILISQTYRKVAYYTMLHFKPYGITTEQWLVLLTISRHEGVTQTQLADLTKKDKTTITRIVDSLERKKWVRRRPSVDDRRVVHTIATSEGKRLAEVLAQVERAVLDALFATYSEEDKEQLRRALFAVQARVDTQMAVLNQVDEENRSE